MVTNITSITELQPPHVYLWTKNDLILPGKESLHEKYFLISNEVKSLILKSLQYNLEA